MLAKEKHVRKYAELYQQRGIDVLAVRMSQPEFLIPQLGSHRIARDLVDYLEQQPPERKLIFHGMSLGVYLTCEIFREVQERLANDQKRQSTQQLIETVSVLVFDGIVDPELTPYTTAKAMAGDNVLIEKSLAMMIWSYLMITYPIALKHYRAAARAFFTTPIRCPVLIFASEADTYSNMEIVSRVTDAWRKMDIKVDHKIFKDTQHLEHFRKYPQEFEKSLIGFLEKNKVL